MTCSGNLQVLAFTSDAEVDFTPVDFDRPLTTDQQAYLRRRTGKDIPQVFWRKQVHEDLVIAAEGMPADCRLHPDADAFVTNQKGLPIAIRTADCGPIFIVDPVHEAIGVAHAGWKGTQKQIALKTIKTLQDKYGSQCYDLRVTIGPAIRACCYEVGEEFHARFPQDVARRRGRLYFDMVAANIRQLMEAGVESRNITDTGVCTACSKDHFSFRRDGAKAGRMISLMMLL